ncbi:OmpH family outer membrane protein [bacterium]|nr:OmpH family outer membrane protein [bacterium]
MQKKLFYFVFIAVYLIFSPTVFSFNFGYVDAGKLFNNYAETKKTKGFLESEKGKLQQELDAKKKEVADLDAKYLEIAKKLQALRDSKKDAEAKSLETQLRAQREALSKSNEELQKFFEESQKRLYQLEDDKMGKLTKVLDERVDNVIKQIATSKQLEAVFEKRFCYFGGVDITEEVIATLNAGGPGGTNAAAGPANGAKKKTKPE